MELPSRPQTSTSFFPLYSEPAPLQQSQGGWSQAPPWGEGRGAQGKDEAWRGAHRPRSQQGREVEPFPIMSYRGCRLSPGDPTWTSQYRLSDSSVKGGVGGEQPQTWLILSPSAPHTPKTLLSFSSTTSTMAPSPTPCPQACPSGKLRDICCVTETGLFPGQSRRVGCVCVWGG